MASIFGINERQWTSERTPTKKNYDQIMKNDHTAQQTHTHTTWVWINAQKLINCFVRWRVSNIQLRDWPEKSGKSKIINTSNRINYGTSSIKPMKWGCEEWKKNASKQPKNTLNLIEILKYIFILQVIAHFGAVKAQKNPPSREEREKKTAHNRRTHSPGRESNTMERERKATAQTATSIQNPKHVSNV